jgi:hypothetical protein
MIKDTVTLKGKLTISLNGKIVRTVNNLVVTVGKEWIASRMQGVVDGVMTHMAIGEGVTAAVVADTALETEATRVALTVSGGAVVGRVITFLASIAADDPDITAPAVTSVTEAGIFNDPTTGDMLARTVFPVVSKGETDSMDISWAITIN